MDGSVSGDPVLTEGSRKMTNRTFGRCVCDAAIGMIMITAMSSPVLAQDPPQRSEMSVVSGIAAYISDSASLVGGWMYGAGVSAYDAGVSAYSAGVSAYGVSAAAYDGTSVVMADVWT